jgi:hypothetical protein
MQPQKQTRGCGMQPIKHGVMKNVRHMAGHFNSNKS